MRIKAFGLLALSTLIILLSLPPTSFAGDRRARGFVQGRTSRTVIYRPHYWGGWGDPFWGGYYAPNYYVPDYRGKVKLKGFNDLDQVYVNGAFAGSIDDMDSFRLDPGRYSIVIKENGREILRRDIYVVSGKTIDITRNLKE